MSPNQPTPDNSKIEVELLSFANLLNYSKGSSQSAVENFMVDISADEVVKLGEDSPTKKLKQKAKSLFSKEKQAQSQPSRKPKRKVEFGQVDIQEPPKPSPSGRAAPSPTPSGMPTRQPSLVRYTKNYAGWIFLILALIAIGAGYFFLPQITGSPEKSSAEIVIDFSQNVVEKVKNIKNIVIPNEQIPVIPTTQPVATTSPQPQPTTIEIEKLNIQKSIDQAINLGQISVIQVKKQEIGDGSPEKPVHKQVWNEITGKQTSFTKQGLYKYLEETAAIASDNVIYFVDIQDQQGNQIGLQELNQTLGIELPSWSKNIISYRLMFFLEPPSNSTQSRVRLGFIYMFPPGKKPPFMSLKTWESTAISELNPLYMPANQTQIEKGKFEDSTITTKETRRFINFTKDQSLSLDYALAQDGLIVVTSRDFGTALLNILVQEQEESE
ncbi:MAG: hypothetical protein GF332_03650 [Candidatus Moranbacteria bacterium]|nr:hypothetical protein [Candidatus Moranbacteria bacterium]